MTQLKEIKLSKAMLKHCMLYFLSYSQSCLNKISINKLTLIGFTLVAIPLMSSLLYSANKVNQLAKQSTNDIYNVAQLSQLNNRLDETITKMERSSSQYIVLKDPELLNAFNRHHSTLQDITINTISSQRDNKLKELLSSLKLESNKIKGLMNSDIIDTLSLEQIQNEFRPLNNINAQLEKRSHILVNEQVQHIHATSDNITGNILERLFIIPATLLVAGIFIILITKPLKRLTDKIKILEQGTFEQEIKLHGPAEVTEIADALEKMRQRLHTLELQKSSFIRHISHELKTPLAAIREGTELIYDNSVGPLNDDQQEICDIIRSSVGRLQRLIEDLLDFNIVLDSTSLHHLEKINLADLISDACNVRKLDIKAKSLTLKCDYRPYIMYSNSKQLSVILDNILSNAIKYSPNDGDLTITYHSDQNYINLDIIDQGPGIETHLCEKVFDAFYQGKSPENSQIKGSGLGLTIVKELLLRLNGSIKITAAEPGNDIDNVGTCVRITLPNTQITNE